MTKYVGANFIIEFDNGILKVVTNDTAGTEEKFDIDEMRDIYKEIIRSMNYECIEFIRWHELWTNCLKSCRD